MGTAIINVIGVLASVLGIVQFGEDNFGGQDSGGSVVRIQVGLDNGSGLSNSGGDMPDVRLFNEVGEFLGATYDPGHIDDGTTGSDIKISQTSEQQATYGLFTANDDAICIAYLSIVWPDEQKFGWTGDWGRECGATWYYSNIVLSGQKDKPACMWIDKNKDQPVTAFQIHFPDFITQDNQQPAHDRNFYCANGPPFSLYYNDDPNTITFNVPSKLKAKSKRTAAIDVAGTLMQSDPHPRPQRLRRADPVLTADPRLVISGDPKQTAAGLCGSDVSLGPDFFNVVEGQFCHMSTKTVHPICDTTVVDNCFDPVAHKLIVGGKTTRDAEYSKVIDWSDGT